MQLVFCRSFVNHPHRYSTPTFRKIGTVRKHQNPIKWSFFRKVKFFGNFHSTSPFCFSGCKGWDFPIEPPWFSPVSEGFLPAKKLKNNPKFCKEKWTWPCAETSQMKAEIEPAGEEKYNIKKFAHGTSKEISRRVDSELFDSVSSKTNHKKWKEKSQILHGHLCNGNVFLQNYTHIFTVESSPINLAV